MLQAEGEINHAICLEIKSPDTNPFIEIGLNVKRVLDSLNADEIRRNLADYYHHTGPGRTPIARAKQGLLKL